MYTNRNAAALAGAKTFYTGRVCRRGHKADRYTSTGQCVECMKYGSRPQVARIEANLPINVEAEIAEIQARFDRQVGHIREEAELSIRTINDRAALGVKKLTSERDDAVAMVRKRAAALTNQAALLASKQEELNAQHREAQAAQEAALKASTARDAFRKVMKRIRVTIAPDRLLEAEGIVIMNAMMRCPSVTREDVCKGTDPQYPMEVYYAHPDDWQATVDALNALAPAPRMIQAPDVAETPAPAASDWLNFEEQK